MRQPDEYTVRVLLQGSLARVDVLKNGAPIVIGESAPVHRVSAPEVQLLRALERLTRQTLSTVLPPEDE